MGIKLVVPGVNFESAGVGLIPPVSDGLEGLFLMNDSTQKVAKNWAPGKLDAVVAGSPTVSSGFASLTGDVNYVQTQVDEYVDMTIMMAVRGTSDSSTTDLVPVFISNRNSPTEFTGGVSTGGITISPTSATNLRFTDQRWDGANSTGDVLNLAAYSPNTWAVYSARTRGSSKTIRNMTTGTLAGGTETTQRNRATGKMKIGSTGTIPSATQGTCDVAITSFFSRYLSDTEETTMYNWMKSYLAGRGVIV